MSNEKLTRRGWLLQIGEATALTGFSGNHLFAADPLPPGVFDPSLEHLGHLMAEQARATGSLYTPQFFSAGEFRTVTHYVAVLLGEDAASPVVSEVAGWVDLSIFDSAQVRQAVRALSPANRTLADRFYGAERVEALAETDDQAIAHEGLKFLAEHRFDALAEPERVALLTGMEKNSDRFFKILKNRTIQGFYTSRQGLKELDYKGNSFYSVCPGCNTEPGR
jgi:hypothetical protein